MAAIVVGIFVGLPICVLLLVFDIILVAFLAGEKRTRKRRIFSRVVQWTAAGLVVAYPIATFTVEHNSSGIAVGTFCSGLVFFFACLGFILAQVLARKCMRSEGQARSEFNLP